MKYPVELLTQAEVQALLEACNMRYPSGARNRALLAVLYRGGLRVSEALALYPKDIDPAAGTLRVLHGKGDKARTVAMDRAAFDILHVWMNFRARIEGVSMESPVFCTVEKGGAGGRLAPVYVRNLFKRLGRVAGIAKRVHPHLLRHVAFFEMANEGVPMHVIQQIAGHSNLSTTQIYISHLNPKVALDIMKSRDWKPAI